MLPTFLLLQYRANVGGVVSRTNTENTGNWSVTLAVVPFPGEVVTAPE